MFLDARHYDRFTRGLIDEVDRSSRSVKEGRTGLTDPQVQRFKDGVDEGEDFLQRMLALEGGEVSETNARRVRRMNARSAQQIIGIVAAHDGVDASGYRAFRSPPVAKT